MKWFGESWGAPVCKETEHTETPDCICIQCEAKIQKDDQGFVMPYSGPELDKTIMIKEGNNFYLVYHLDCFLGSIGVK